MSYRSYAYAVVIGLLCFSPLQANADSVTHVHRHAAAQKLGVDIRNQLLALAPVQIIAEARLHSFLLVPKPASMWIR